MKATAADNRLILQASLDHKGNLKRRICTLQDVARKIWFKIFASAETQRNREEAFYREELVILEMRSLNATTNWKTSNLNN